MSFLPHPDNDRKLNDYHAARFCQALNEQRYYKGVVENLYCSHLSAYICMCTETMHHMHLHLRFLCLPVYISDLFFLVICFQ